MTLSVSINAISEALKMEPCVGFLLTAPVRFVPGTAEELWAIKDCRPGSGITDDRRDPALPESDGAGEAGFVYSVLLEEFKAISKTSRKNKFLVEERRVICSSGTVSLFFSMKPSTSYVTSRA